jgi:hypothetical protein
VFSRPAGAGGAKSSKEGIRYNQVVMAEFARFRSCFIDLNGFEA